MTSLLSRQINWLRQLSRVSRDEIQVMLQPSTPWIPLFDIIQNPPKKPIHSRIILKNEIVMEIDNDNWEVVRDGTRKLIHTLEKWGGKEAYYLSYSGNRSIHVHVFADFRTVQITSDVSEILKGHDDVISTIKAYWTRQFIIATGAVVDTQLTGKHLIRMEGGFNEKSRKYCTMITDIPEDKPLYYDISVPSRLPDLWDISRFTPELNAYLKIHYTAKTAIHYNLTTQSPFDPDPLVDVLKPVFIPGHRHMFVLCVAGWLMRHGIPEEKAREIIKQLNPHDKTPAKTMGTVKRVYKARDGDKIPGFHKLLSIIEEEFHNGEISSDTTAQVKNALRNLPRHITQEVMA